MQANNIQKVVIVGGGTAGWMTAAALSQFLDTKNCSITLIESEEIGTVGVGEATLPHLRFFNQRLGIDEQEFMRATNATYKMGIQFVNWGQLGESYLHPFGDFGHKINGLDFHQYWLKQHQAGKSHNIEDYSLAVMAAQANKFEFPDSKSDLLRASFSYAYHVDSGLYAKFLRQYAEQKGVTRIEGKVQKVCQDNDSGFIQSVMLDSGQVIEGELFVDCSGFRGLLIEQTLKTGYQDWSDCLPCDSALAVGSERAELLLPYSRATARESGWQWRIPLRHRTGNGYVYSSKFISDENAKETLLNNIEGKPLQEPIQLRFTTGKRNRVWEKNVVAVGLSSGFLEPLESTGIFLIQDTIDKLLDFFPSKAFEPAPIAEFNRLMANEYERIRDFLVLHYHATQRNDTPFWDYCRTMTIPDSLQHKMALFEEQGHICHYRDGLFYEPSWLAVYLGQGILPKHFHPKVQQFSDQRLNALFIDMKAQIVNIVQDMPMHEDTLNAYLNSTDNSMNKSNAATSLYGARR